MINKIRNFFSKLSRSNQDNRDNSLKRISTAVSQINLKAESSKQTKNDPYYDHLFHHKASLIEESLLKAKRETKIITDFVNQPGKKPQELEEALKNIIKNCESISLSGIQIFSGEALHLKYQQEELVIKLPDYTKDVRKLSGETNAPEIEACIKDLEKAIDHSLNDLEKFKTQIETSQQNYLSAGIDLALLQKQSDC